MCACLMVLDLALLDFEKGKQEFVSTRGIEALIKATRWDPEKSSLEVPCDILDLAEVCWLGSALRMPPARRTVG